MSASWDDPELVVEQDDTELEDELEDDDEDNAEWGEAADDE